MVMTSTLSVGGGFRFLTHTLHSLLLLLLLSFFHSAVQYVSILSVHSHIGVAMEILWSSCVLVVLVSVGAAHSHTGSQGICSKYVDNKNSY